MLTRSRLWHCRQAPDDVIAELAHDLRLSTLTARLLALRGVQNAKQADAYLGKRLTDLHKPEQMRDMDVAAQRFAQAIANRERIVIHGDYDVDGSTATALLTLFVRACSHEAIAWIPHRRIDGYGLGEASLAAVREHRAQLMITVDCGIIDQGWAARIERETGCHVIITDHHLPQGELPHCTAVCNPNRPDCPYPDKHLAGVGVAWKLAWATAKCLSGADKVSTRLRDYLMDSLSLVALGTIADCAALDGENRILVHHGLMAFMRSANPGLKALREQVRVEDEISAGDVGWKIGPLLNAAGRVGSAMANIRLLTATDDDEARVELAAIVSENEERKRLTQALTTELLGKVESDPALRSRNTLVFAGEGWHQGVVGIVASRLVEAYGKPSAVIALADGAGKGSMRSVPCIHLGEALAACREHIDRGGGHAMAAGLTIAATKVADFTAAFEQWVGGRIGNVDLSPGTDYDGDAAITDIDDDFFANLARLAPFGTGNPEPLVCIRDASFITRPRLFGKDGDHVRGALTDLGGGLKEMVAWRGKERFPAFSAAGARFDLLVRPQVNRWRGELQYKLVFVDGQTR
jgi:single-stranded-DNA-specific exonuclease